MKERPIIFSAPMVRAILEGRKTQMRIPVDLGYRSDGTERFCGMKQSQDGSMRAIFEASLCEHVFSQDLPHQIGERLTDSDGLSLEITAVRVERLQEISEEEAEAEGVYEHLGEPQVECDGQVLHFPDASFVREYRHVWQSIHGPGSWDANPWVWVLEFKRVEGGK